VLCKALWELDWYCCLYLMSVDCLYGHACACARTHTRVRTNACARTSACARARACPQVVQPVFRLNTENSRWVDLLMWFIEPAVEPAGWLRWRSTIAGSLCGRVILFSRFGCKQVKYTWYSNLKWKDLSLFRGGVRAVIRGCVASSAYYILA
jgi:hypothetical protein